MRQTNQLMSTVALALAGVTLQDEVAAQGIRNLAEVARDNDYEGIYRTNSGNIDVKTIIDVTECNTHSQQVSLSNVGSSALTYDFDLTYVYDDNNFAVTFAFDFSCTKTWSSATNGVYQKCGTIGSFADV